MFMLNVYFYVYVARLCLCLYWLYCPIGLVLVKLRNDKQSNNNQKRGMNSRPVIRNNKNLQSRDKYQELVERHSKGEFTYDAHCIIQKLTEKGKTEPHMEGVELYRILIEITKILLLNELQILFLGATLQEMKWKVIDTCLNPYIEGYVGLSPKLKADNYGKKMQMSLLLIGYVVKLYLNEDIQIFDFKMRELITKDYDRMYQEWVEKMRKNFKFNPKNMNKLFKELDIIRSKKTVELDDLNYNNKVQELFEKYVEENVKDYASRGERTPIEEEEIEEEPIVPTAIMRESSIQSLRSMTQRESFREIVHRGERGDTYLSRNLSFLRNNSQDDFMG